MPPRNRMLTGYVFNVTFTYPDTAIHPEHTTLVQRVIYEKGPKEAETLLRKMITSEWATIEYLGYFFQ